MSIEKMREQFESWVLREYPNQSMGRFNDGEYQSLTVENCWLSWKASREAVVVNLPVRDMDLCAYSLGFNSCLGQARQSLEDQGLKVAP